MPKSDPTFKPWHWILEDLTLTAYQKIVALVLLVHTNGKGVAWPTVARISKMTGISERSVQRVLHQLQAKKIASRAGSTGDTKQIAVWKIEQLQPSMFTSQAVLDRKKGRPKGCHTVTLTDTAKGCHTVTLHPAKGDPQSPLGGLKGDSQSPNKDHQILEKVRSSKPSPKIASHQDQVLRGDPVDRLDDFRKNVLSRCEDTDGILATALDIIVDRIRQSGVNVNSPKYLEVALANFDFQQGEDREQLMQRLRRRRN